MWHATKQTDHIEEHDTALNNFLIILNIEVRLNGINKMMLFCYSAILINKYE